MFRVGGQQIDACGVNRAVAQKIRINLSSEGIDKKERIYSSPQKMYYQQALSLTKRLLTVYPQDRHRELILRLIDFPIRVCSHKSRYDKIEGWN